jgi:hypothetical protein
MNPFYDTPAFFFIVLALYIIGSLLDIYSSVKTSWYYGVYEKNKLSRDADGEFDLKKNSILKAGTIPVSIAAGLIGAYGFGLGEPWGASCAMLIAGAFWYPIQCYLNFNLAKKNRAQQLAIVEQIRNAGTYSTAFIGRNGKVFAALFHWLYVPDTGNMVADEQAAINKLTEFVKAGAKFPR